MLDYVEFDTPFIENFLIDTGENIVACFIRVKIFLKNVFH